MHINGAKFGVRWIFLQLWYCEVRSGFLPSTQEGLFRVVPATFPGKHEHLTVWERSSMRFLLQHRCAAMTSHVPPSVDANTHTHVHQWHIWDTPPSTHHKNAHILVWSEAVWYMTSIRDTRFSNTHQRCKQISDKYTFLRSTVREEHDFTEGESSSTAYRGEVSLNL